MQDTLYRNPIAVNATGTYALPNDIAEHDVIEFVINAITTLYCYFDISTFNLLLALERVSGIFIGKVFK